MFIDKYAQKYRRQAIRLSDEAEEALKCKYWSGNIRELQNCIEKAVILSEGDAEEKAIRAAMDRFGGNLSMVAKLLNISRPTLYAKLKKYDI